MPPDLSPTDLPAADRPLLALLQALDQADYDFVTPTPATHARVVARRAAAGDLRDILGWSLPFDPATAPPGLCDRLAAAGLLQETERGLKSGVRVSRLKGRLYLHSAYPTEGEDAVFFGPDSYRFADFVARELAGTERGRLVDVGCGAGVGGLVAAGAAPGLEPLLTDVNPLALRFARINAAHAGVPARFRQTEGLQGVEPGVAVVIANPPYMAASEQTYRDGGDMHGGELSVDFARQALAVLRPGGRLLLYTGSAIVRGGADPLRAALVRLAEAPGARLRYAELDPDVFGEELERAAYRDVERIAVVGAVLTAGAA